MECRDYHPQKHTHWTHWEYQKCCVQPRWKYTASGSSDRTIRLWNVADATLRNTLTENTSDVETTTFVPVPEPTGGVLSVAFSPDGNTLASGSYDDIVRLWNVGTARLRNTLTGYTRGVLSVAFSPDGNTLASGSYDDIVRLWNVADATLRNTLRGHTDTVSSVAFSPDGNTLASGSYDDIVRLWNVADATLRNTLRGHTDTVLSVAFSPNGNTLASGSFDRTIRLWNVGTATLRNTLTGHIWLVDSVAFSPDGNTLASGSADETVRLWNVGTATLRNTLTGHTNGVSSVAFSPDGNTLASGSSDRTVRLWNVGTATLRNTLTGHTNTVLSVAFSPDGNTLASGGYDETVRLWNVGTATLRNTLTGHIGGVESVAFSPDGNTLASGSSDGTVLLWRITPSPPGPGSDPLDVNRDGRVTALDLMIVAMFYGMRVPTGGGLWVDVNADGIVNILDLTAVANGIDADNSSLQEFSLQEIEAALLAAEEAAEIEAIAEAPNALLRGNRPYRNVAAALADAKQLATSEVHLEKGVQVVLEKLLQLLTEMQEIPDTTALLPNYPNPFNPETWIPYHLATDAAVTVTIHDVRGVLVRALPLGYQAAGVYESRARAASWDGRNESGESVASGLYFYTFTAGDFTATRKLLIAK